MELVDEIKRAPLRLVGDYRRGFREIYGQKLSVPASRKSGTAWEKWGSRERAVGFRAAVVVKLPENSC